VPALRIGTSGWVYRHWMGVFYPPDLAGDELLPFYATHFDSVEINYSFYRLPERSTFEFWRRQVPPHFLFAVKASRFLTHMKKLSDPEKPLARLMERAAGLGERLGPILFQLPHTWGRNTERLAGFIDALSRYAPQRFAFEFRHASWLVPDVYTLLERAGAALCLPVHPTIPLEVRTTAPWTYIRLHGGRHGIGYGDDELAEWVRRIRGFLGSGLDVYVYFNNDAEGHAVRDAGRLKQLLSVQGSNSDSLLAGDGIEQVLVAALAVDEGIA